MIKRCCNREMYFSQEGYHCSICGKSNSLEQIKNNINVSYTILDDSEMNLKEKINEEWKVTMIRIEKENRKMGLR